MTALYVLELRRLAVIVAMVATPVAAFAQGAAPPTDLHQYPLPTYEEDWRALQGVDRTDVWDPLKFVPLSADGTTSLSLGGEARATYERFGNPNFGMYALREGPNVPLSFDGVRVIAHGGPWQLDGWAARPVDTTPGVFEDGSHRSFDVWGVYGSRVIAPSRFRVGLDVYYLGLARDAAQCEQGTAKRATPSARASGAEACGPTTPRRCSRPAASARATFARGAP